MEMKIMMMLMMMMMMMMMMILMVNTSRILLNTSSAWAQKMPAKLLMDCFAQWRVGGHRYPAMIPITILIL